MLPGLALTPFSQSTGGSPTARLVGTLINSRGEETLRLLFLMVLRCSGACCTPVCFCCFLLWIWCRTPSCKIHPVPLPGLPVGQPHLMWQCAGTVYGCDVMWCDVIHVGSSDSSFNMMSKFFNLLIWMLYWEWKQPYLGRTTRATVC